MAIFSDSGALSNLTMLLLSILVAYFATAAADFYRDAEITWGDGRAKILEGGRMLTLSLDQQSGSGFQSKNDYLFGRFDLQLKLVPGNSAGTVTTFFCLLKEQDTTKLISSSWETLPASPTQSTQMCMPKAKGTKNSDSISGSIQLLLSTLTPSSGILSASCNFLVLSLHRHLFVSIISGNLKVLTDWNWILCRNFRFLVDNIPIRVFSNNEAIGIPFPKSQAMRVQCSLWNADDWATQGGRVKTDWSKAPFVASYRNFNINGCVAGSSCGSKSADSFNTEAWQTKELDAKGRNRLRWVQQKHMIYNYCTDVKRFPQGIPAECRRSRF
ncbi:UNVERIFIED_CONTAM: Xyloglucan endotransglucosylase/hydrolase protein 15 [Sesamum radiatum]|uniref:Xyloglucan endotransglucosylase/hydrolase n=1 Tax=Sesamum radiatum TaxID=300843 RepID=A0AAW2T5F9_SESRA